MEIPKGYKVKYIKGEGPSRVRGKTIFIPEWETEREKQESLAHEIAHIKLGHRSSVEGQESIYDFLPKEMEAQKLGRSLLGRRRRLPSRWIARIIENTTERINRGAKGRVSIWAIADIFQKRAEELGLPEKDIERAIAMLERRYGR